MYFAFSVSNLCVIPQSITSKPRNKTDQKLYCKPVSISRTDKCYAYCRQCTHIVDITVHYNIVIIINVYERGLFLCL